MDRYEIPGGHDSQFEPDSNQTVLRNRLDIRAEAEMQMAETTAYLSSVSKSFRELEDDFQFSVDFVRDLHRDWLGSIYDFAGEYRVLNVSKGSILFCHAAFIPEQMILFDEQLKTVTPCRNMNLDHMCSVVAKVHADLVLIHPFREGNGRLARWLSNLMIAQAGYPAIKFNDIQNEEEMRSRYFSALRRGFLEDFGELSLLFEEWIRSS